jgi:hypothetical protein
VPKPAGGRYGIPDRQGFGAHPLTPFANMRAISRWDERIIHHQGVFLGRLPLGRSREVMSEKSTNSDPVVADPAPAPVMVARPKLKTDRKAQDWRRAGIVIAGFFVLATIGFVLAMVTTYPKPAPTTNAMLGGKLSTGKIVSYSGEDKECRQQVFNNETGQMTKPEPCDMQVLDPASSNPVNRLDAISKAFSGR